MFRSANSTELARLNGGREKHKARGRNKISAKLRRKQKNVIDASSVKLREKMRAKAKASDAQGGAMDPEESRKEMRKKHGALLRFATVKSTSVSTDMNTESRRKAF